MWNHRYALDSGILVKENHIRAAGGIVPAVESLRKVDPFGSEIEVEVCSLEEAQEAIGVGVRRLLLDNFSSEELMSVTKSLRSECADLILEASGNITEENLDEYLDSGVDIISMGVLTHSVKAVDLSLLFDFQH